MVMLLTRGPTKEAGISTSPEFGLPELLAAPNMPLYQWGSSLPSTPGRGVCRSISNPPSCKFQNLKIKFGLEGLRNICVTSELVMRCE